MNSIFPLKVTQVVLVFSHLTGLVWATEVTFTLSVGALLLTYWVMKVTTASKSFLFLSGCALTVATAVDSLSHLMPFNRYQTFDPGSRPWYQYSIRFLRITWYLICWATYFSQFHAFCSPSYVDICKVILASEAVMLTLFGPNYLEWMAYYAPLQSFLDLCWCPFRSDPGFCTQFWCLSCTLLYCTYPGATRP